MSHNFYAPGLKGPLGASSNRIVRPSVCPFVCLSVCPSVRNSVPLTIKVQYLKFGWWYSYQTWTVSSSKGCSHFTDITRPWGVGQGQNVGLRDFCHNWTLLPPGASVFHKHMSSSLLKTQFVAKWKSILLLCHNNPLEVSRIARFCTHFIFEKIWGGPRLPTNHFGFPTQNIWKPNKYQNRMILNK